MIIFGSIGWGIGDMGGPGVSSSRRCASSVVGLGSYLFYF